MAVIKKDGGFMALPINIKRGNPIPLDSTSVWYNYEELENYAKTSVTAYVGQIVTYIDEEVNTATVYVIADAEGSLLKVGSGAGGGDAVNVDNNTIVLDDEGLLSLKDFGKKYYKYVAATDDDPATYVLQEVDEDHPWQNGLTPQVVSENGQFVIGWYEPNPTTLEGINTAISGLQTDIAGIKKDYLTKEEAKAEFAGATHYRGTVESKDDLELKSDTAVAGDIYIVKDSSKEYIYDGENWEELGGQNDLLSLETRVGSLENAQTIIQGKVSSLENELSLSQVSIKNLQDTDTIFTARVEALETNVAELTAVIGAPAGEDASATGIYKVIDDKIDSLQYVRGVTINGTDAPISEGKVQLFDFNKTEGVSGLVPVPSQEILTSDITYVLSATGDWIKPQDTRIGTLNWQETEYNTVTEYIDARVDDSILTWSNITD